jgi:hypothetical protein
LAGLIFSHDEKIPQVMTLALIGPDPHIERSNLHRAKAAGWLVAKKTGASRSRREVPAVFFASPSSPH